MASNRIKGITIEIGGDTVGLQSALKDVNKRSSELTSELKDIQRMLKFNPNSTELLAQKQQLLTQQVAETTDKLQQLRAAEQQVQAQFERGDIGEEQYRGFRRELLQTEQALQGYQQSITEMNRDQQRVGEGTRQMGAFFEATGTSVQDYAHVIGNRLVTAMQNGTATSRDLEYAFRHIGREAIGANGDIERLRATLASVDDGNSIANIRRDLQTLQSEAEQTEESVNGISDSLKNAAGALVAGGGIAGAVSQALDLSNLDTKIRISMEIPEESISTVKEVVRSVEAYGVDTEAALEGVRRQWTLNADATDEANAAIVKSAAGITAAFAGVDLIELVQETNEIAAAIGITNEQAIGLTNSLLKAGFPPEQLDTISEYGTQMALAGFSAAEIQSIFEKGIDTKTWNIDNLNDGVKEARLTMAGFGSEVDKALIPLVEKSGISTKQFQDWGIAVANGGKEGSLAMGEVAEWLEGIDNKTLKNDISTKVFGTKWEDQGPNMVAVYKDVANAVDKTTENTKGMQDTMDTLNADPLVQIKQAWSDMKLALEPLLLVIADFVGKIASVASQNPMLVASIVAIGSAIGILIAAVALLAPAFIAIAGAVAGAGGAASVLGIAIAALTSPVTIIIAAIVAFGIALVALWRNSETFRDGVTSVFNKIKAVAIEVFEIVSSFIQEKLASIKSFWDQNGAQFLQAVENVFKGIMTVVEFIMPAVLFVVEMVWTAIKQVIDGALSVIMGLMKVFSGLFTGDFSKMWEGIKQIFTGAIDLIVGLMTLTFVGGIKSALVNLAKVGISLVKGLSTSIVGLFKSFTTTGMNLAKSMVNGVLGFFRNLLSTAKSIFTSMRDTGVSIWKSIFSSIKGVAQSIFNTVKTQFTNMVSSIRSIFSTVKSTISSIWDSVLSFFRGIDLTSIGKNIIKGLINGIGSMASAVYEKAKSLANGVKNAISKAMDIHSPSRVTHKLGEHTGQGFANGIAAKKKTAEAAAKKTADATKKAFSSAMDKAQYNFKMGKINSSELITALRKIRSEYAKTPEQVRKVNLELKKVEDKQAKDIASIKNKQFKEALKLIKDKAAAGKISAATELKQLAALASKYGKNSAERLAIDIEYKKVKEKMLKDQAAADKKKFNADLKSIKDKAQLGKITAKEEVKQLEKLASKYKKNSEERISVEKEIKKVKDQIAKDEEAALKKKFDNEKSAIENKKYYNQMSLQEELAAYQKNATKYKKGSEERIYYEKEIYRVKKEINDKLTTLTEEYATKQKEINDKLIDGQKQLNDAYESAVDSRAKAIYSSTGLFDVFKEMSDVTGQDLIDNLLSQVTGVDKWQTSLAAIAKRGLPKDLITELEELGPDAYAEIGALNSLTDQQLGMYVSLWEQKNRQAREIATKELEGMKADTTKKIAELTATANKDLTLLKNEYTAKFKEIAKVPATEMKIMNSSMKTIGNDAIKGLMAGLAEMEGPLKKQAKAMADAVSDTIKSALKIKSPSRVTMGLGEFAGEGLEIGMKNSLEGITQQAKNMANAAIPNLSGSYPLSSTLNGLGISGSSVTHNQPININVEYNGSGGREDAYSMADIISNKLASDTKNRFAINGVR